MRVMTWNVWGRFGPWRERAPLILAILETLQADVVCLQETWSTQVGDQANELATSLGLHAVFGRSRMPRPESGDSEHVLCGLAVLGRWPVLRHRLHVLPDGPEGSPPEHGAPSVALVVTFDHPAGPLHVVTACPDWQAEREGARLAQNRTLAALLTDPALDGPLPVILAADLNSRPDTPEFQPLAQALVDAWATTHPGEPGYTFTTDNRFVGPDEWLADGRIDHILARSGTPGHPLAFLATALAGTGDPAPSDHYAVVADLDG
ncbi:endonuclease/exonuclease/phosphatase family protein [Streptomyces sp. NBC_00286]|uniref:endonuclease/exonuclease/phosphatase family protein n=1 Tax=Streptomyces sp. NBC_00286 TaxID=2975701 RepID=UPI002E28B18C|nr:endonuclease/exonuclease/phosphatase family protein [Streptomyces sp. NBC_00286]